MEFNLTLIAQAVVFAIFIWVTARWPWRWLMEMIEARNKTIAEGLAAAERGQRSMEDAAVKSEAHVQAARSQAQEILNAASRQASQTVDEARATARQEAERIVAGGRSQVERDLAAARETLRKQVGELAVLGAARILKREINPQTHADVIKDLTARI